MLLNTLLFKTGGQCVLTFEQPDGWLRSTWTGFIGTDQAMRGARNYLEQVEAIPFECPYFLNDNVHLRGPWFDTVEWLERAWLPQAQRLGLRYVAHVVQADTRLDVLTLSQAHRQIEGLEVQLFEEIAAAEEWLRSCQQLQLRPSSLHPGNLI